MEKIFITMHDLSPEARIVYASDSVTDVLGYPAADVVGLSCFDFFHPEQLPFARKVHTRGIHLDKAAVLVYCQVRHKDGRYVDCETIFSVVYDVFVAATSMHVRTSKSQGRALTAPVIRRVFSSSPNDPRYHMLTHLSTKFRMESSEHQEQHEPRIALILNRFTRSLTILYASHASTKIFGITPEELAGKSFFECIDPNCLQDAVDALERAKENDSIAYLRFQWRDPRTDHVEQPAPPQSPTPLRRSNRISAKRKAEDGASSGESSTRPAKRRGAVPRGGASSSQTGESSSTGANRIPIPSREESPGAASSSRGNNDNTREVTEVEAVVSCTSDGLVVILRAARPLIPKPLHNIPGGVFASPWAPTPLVPAITNASDRSRETNFMEAIREVAVFAWSLRQLGGEVIIPGGDNSPADGDSKLVVAESSGNKESADAKEVPKDSGKGLDVEASTPATEEVASKDQPKTSKGRRKQSRR